MTYATKINNYINKLNNTNVYAIDVETTLCFLQMKNL